MVQKIASFTASNAHRAPQLTTESVAQFRYDNTIGRGGHSSIYQVHVPASPESANGLSRLFAVKVARQNIIADSQPIEREAKLLRDLNHPNIVKVYASWKSDDIWCMAMDCYDFCAADLLKGKSSLDVGSTLYILGNLANALEYLHVRGLAQADVKLTNLLMKGDVSHPVEASVALADFDIARPSGEPFSWQPEGLIIGSPNYLTFERWVGDPPQIRHDVYAAACVVYEFLGGVLEAKEFHISAKRNMEAVTHFYHPDERIGPLLNNMASEDGSIRSGIDLVQYLKVNFPEIAMGD